MLQQNNDIDCKQLYELVSYWFVEQKLWFEVVCYVFSVGKLVYSFVQDGVSVQLLVEEGDIDILILWMYYLLFSIDFLCIDL